MWEAWRRVRSNGGAAGVDEETIHAIEQRGVREFLAEIEAALRAGRYRPSSVKRRYISKADGKQRPFLDRHGQLFLQVDSPLFHLLQKSPVTSGAPCARIRTSAC
jgi:hypothetical protein